MAALRSMTGFARLRSLGARGERVLTIRSVNHRALDVHLHLPADLDVYENALRAAVKQKVARGHVDVRLSWNRTGGTVMLALNGPLLESWLAAFRQAQERFGIASGPDLNEALRLPGMLSETDAEPDAELEAELLALLNEGLDAFNGSREKEGAGLAAAIRQANERILAQAAELAELRLKVQPAIEERLKERVASLLEAVSLDPQRVAQEVALLADRSDVTEEIHRLEIHSRQLAELLDRGGEAGKRLDFLMQEMGRETNTILSKTSGAGELGLRITDLGIAVKAEVEKIREQALNLE
ncbi:MAG: YicC family protein [Acidobacteria bacterium]|nr:YicC family protein [Acidobacteriota bacterium]